MIAPFIFMQLADLYVYAMINFAHWQNTKYRQDAHYYIENAKQLNDSTQILFILRLLEPI